MQLRNFTAACVFLMLSISGDCRIFKRSTIDSLLTTEETEHYLPKENSHHNYEIIKLFTKRNAGDDVLNLYFKANDGNKELILLPKKDYLLPRVLPVWLGMPQMGQHKYVHCDISILQSTLKHYTTAGGASFSIADVVMSGSKKRVRRETKINGIMGDMTIRSFPPTIVDKIKRAKREVDETEYYSHYHENNYTEVGWHFVSYLDRSGDFQNNFDEIDQVNDHLNMRVKRNDVDGIPDTLYPRILLTTHYNNGFKDTSDPGIENLILYILTFWGAVDLKFFAFENPKIRLHIAGLIIETQYEALPYISENQLLKDVEAIEVHDTMKQMSNYYREQEGELDAILDETNPHITVSMTKY